MMTIKADPRTFGEVFRDGGSEPMMTLVHVVEGKRWL